MLVVARFRYNDAEDAGGAGDSGGPGVGRPMADLGLCLDRLRTHPGFVSGSVGRALDDPGLWLLITSWRDVGSYRRALSSYEVKLQAVPLLSRAVDEPSAYEVVEPGTVLNIGSTRSLG